ncbi:SOH1-domain-containing protein [Talaromyces proteolyticus]|uniref:Mediator of RNA polymerase II transcription subunit 31 n=1 Tax=Talaromyces proteolyticus TaxID=1131652 RepID=A0AAD4KIY4_9EURO|nr:SOH1-domain-containing protein [Talaromyces proteolyticus]KAH8692749.1 SOH1-domain-containing protein [Talaromyces proteolyticus]
MDTQPPPPSLTNPRFTLELEFVLSLANPYYLSHLAVNFPNLLGTSTIDKGDDESSGESTAVSREAQAFHAYLAYLYSYWKTPEYAQFLTHPGATLRALRLLQEESFRRDIIRPQVIESLLAGDADLQAAAVENIQPSTEDSNGVQAS